MLSDICSLIAPFAVLGFTLFIWLIWLEPQRPILAKLFMLAMTVLLTMTLIEAADTIVKWKGVIFYWLE